VLRDALAKTKKVAVGQLIMHGREHLVGITTLYADTRSAWTPNFGGNGWESYAKGNTSSSKNLKHAGVACSSGEALQQVSPASRFARISGEGEQRVNEKRSHHAAQGHNHIVMTREALSCNIRELDSSWDRITPRAQRI